MKYPIGAYRRMLTAGRLLVCTLCILAALPGSASSSDSTFTLHPRFSPPFTVQRGLLREKSLQRPKVGLVLSGGGSRGAAQIGVLRALERHGIPIDFIAATSMGSIVGGLYAAGYTVTELESLATHTNWDDVIVLGDETQRSQLFLDQKLADDRSFIAIRFEGFEPVLPPAVSSGQRLTDFLSARMLQALYYPFPDFDHLKIPFRAVATDLVSGNRIVIRDGSLAEAMRASATVPLLFSPIEKDSMRLVDGGLVSNVPVDVARAAGCDIIIAVNSTSGLRTADEMKSPWQTADQIMGIMMKRLNDRQMVDADVVITPDIGRHLSTSFHGLDSLIIKGDQTTERHMQEIAALYARRSDSLAAVAGGLVIAAPVTVTRGDTTIPDSLWERWRVPTGVGPVPLYDLEAFLGKVYAAGYFDSVWAQVHTGPHGTSLAVYTTPNPTLRSVTFAGNRIIPEAELRSVFAPLLGRVLNHGATAGALEGLTRLYRKRGFSLAHIDSVTFDGKTGALSLTLDEGIIDRIEIQGGVRTKDAFVLQEFPLRPGEVFELDKARRGLSQLSGTTLFEYVYLELTSLTKEIVLTIRIKERPAQLVRFGLHADDERQLQGMVDIRDENWQGTGMQLGFQLSGGQRNGDATLDFSMKRLFNTYLTLGVSIFHRTWDTYLYGNAPKTHPNRWDRDLLGEYRDIRYGFSVSFGSLLERLGNVTAEFIWQNVRVVNVQDLAGMDDRYRLAIVRLATLVDTKDAYPFPTRGVGFKMSYEFSLEGLGSQVGYNSLQAMYENYASWGRYLTFHPRFTLGFADNTMPLAQQFRLGGRDSFFGLREEDRRGRQLILMNMEVRYKLPIQFLFDTYVRARYDLGTISAVPEEIKFSSLLHGVGMELAFATPVGPAVFGVGKAFYFTSELPNQPVQQGPFMAYVMLGYQL